MKETWINDIETLKSCFTSTYLNYDTDECVVFEISSRKNDLESLKEFVQNRIEYCITFNGVDFDDVVTNWLCKQKLSQHKGIKGLIDAIYTVSQELIKADRNETKKYYKYKVNHPYVQIDLLRYWSKMLRLSKNLSLKYFALNLDLDVDEMPIHHSTEHLTSEQIDLVLAYNYNDCYVTKRLAQELKDEINLRVGIQDEFGLECLSMDNIKIGSELLLDFYCKEVYKDNIHINTLLTLEEYKKQVRYTVPHTPDLIYFKNILPDIKFKTQFFMQIYYDMRMSVTNYSKSYVLVNPDNSRLELSFGVGGLHSVNKNQSYQKKKLKNILIKTIDVGSLYPTLYITYGYFYERYKEILKGILSDLKSQRKIAKKAGNKVKDKGLKLVLNGISGLLQNKYSWLKHTPSAIAMRLHGQLILARTMEELNLHGFTVISANTDGIELLVEKDRVELYQSIVKSIEQEFTIEFEEDEYEFINYQSVNDYFALTTSGKVKQKGDFMWSDEKRPGKKLLDGANEFLVVAKAVEQYYINGTDIDSFIRNHSNIYDFCAAKKVDKKYNVIHNGNIEQQLNRYYVTSRDNGVYLYKQRKEKKKKGHSPDQLSMFDDVSETTLGNLENVMKNTPIAILNKRTDKTAQEFNIDYNWYIRKAKKQINTFKEQQIKINI